MGNAASQPGANQQQSQPNGCNQAQDPATPGSPPCGVDQDPSVPVQPPVPPQHMANIPPPMMLSGATPIRAPAPVADQHKHLWKQPAVAKTPVVKQKQPPCGRNQAPCPPTPCPPMAYPQAFQPAQHQQHEYNGVNQYATPSHGVTGGTSYLLGPAAPSYSEGPSDPIPPERPYHDSPQHPHPSSNGKIVCQQIYPKILQNYQNGANGSASPSTNGIPGAVTLSSPSYISNVTASELAVQRPIVGGAL